MYHEDFVMSSLRIGVEQSIKVMFPIFGPSKLLGSLLECAMPPPSIVVTNSIGNQDVVVPQLCRLVVATCWLVGSCQNKAQDCT